MRRYALYLIEWEMKGNESSAILSAAAFPVSEKLQQPLTLLMGQGGFRALLSRALVLAVGEVPWLRAVRVGAGGELEGLEALPERIDAAEFLEGRVELLAQLIGLLVAFIGSSLTLHLVKEIWPNILPKDLTLDLDKGGKNEKTK